MEQRKGWGALTVLQHCCKKLQRIRDQVSNASEQREEIRLLELYLLRERLKEVAAVVESAIRNLGGNTDETLPEDREQL